MLKKKITQSEQQDSWIRSQVNSGQLSNDSEVISELIQERQLQDQETPEQIASIRAALNEAKESVKNKGYSNRTVDEIWNAALKQHLAQNG